MIKRLTIIASIAASILVALFGFATPASAHVLKTDGSIGVVIHIDPEDDPIAGSPATFFFEFKDKDNKFDPANCTCTVAILKGGSTLISEPLFSGTSANNINSPTFQYTFPERAVYTLSITGVPKNAGSFQNFNITYDIRVSRQANGTAAPAPTTTQSHTVHYVLFGAAFVAIAIVFAHDKYKNKKSGQSKNTKPPTSGTKLVGLLILLGLAFTHTHLAYASTCGISTGAVQHQCCAPQAAPRLSLGNAAPSISIPEFQLVEITRPDTSVPSLVVMTNKSPPHATVTTV